MSLRLTSLPEKYHSKAAHPTQKRDCIMTNYFSLDVKIHD